MNQTQLLGFTREQTEMLRKEIPSLVTDRAGVGGKRFDYIPGWAVSDLANAVFGEANWSAEILDERILETRTYPKTVDSKPVDYFQVLALCTVRITVRAPDGHLIIKSRSGIGESECPANGSHKTAYELAISNAHNKAANAAFAKFGPAFGLLLRDTKKLSKNRPTLNAQPVHAVPALHPHAGPAPTRDRTHTPVSHITRSANDQPTAPAVSEPGSQSATAEKPAPTVAPSPAPASTAPRQAPASTAPVHTADTPAPPTTAPFPDNGAADTRHTEMIAIGAKIKDEILATTEPAAHVKAIASLQSDLKKIADYRPDWHAHLVELANNHDSHLRILDGIRRQVAAARDERGFGTLLKIQHNNLARLYTEAPRLHELAQTTIGEARVRLRSAA